MDINPYTPDYLGSAGLLDSQDSQDSQDSRSSTYFAGDHFNLLADDTSVDSLDIDGNGEYDALTDGLLLLRGMFGLTGNSLVSNAIATDANYTSAIDIQARIKGLSNIVDIDANGQADALTDGLLILRYLFGLRGDVLLNGIVSDDADRDTALAIETYVESLLPEIEGSSDLETIYVRLNDQPFTAPYYLFSKTENGAAQTITLEKGASYKFVRTDSGHPFNIGSGWRESLPDFEMSSTSSTNLVSDLGSIEDGQSITLTIPTDFAATTITYYCYTHFSMNATLAVSGGTSNIAPVFSSSPLFSAAENQTSIGSVSATDADNVSISFSISAGDIEITSAGVLSFNVAPDYEANGTYTATVSASDGTNQTSQDITVTVADVDDEAPVFTSPATFSAAENQTAMGTVAATDADSHNASIRYTVSGSDLEIDAVSGALSLKLTPDYETKLLYTATVTASDGANSTTQLITVTITNVDDVAPKFTSVATFNAAENQTTIGTVAATDADSDNASIRFTVSESDLEIDAVSGVLRFQAAPDYETKLAYAATVTLSDGKNSSNQNITVSVIDVDEDPTIISPASFSSDENQAVIGTVMATDPEGADLTFSIVSGTELAISSSGVLTFKTVPDYESASVYTATVAVNDGAKYVTQLITVNVNDVNESPVFTSVAAFSAAENQQAIGMVAATDPEGGIITFSVSGSDLSITPAGVLAFVSAPDYEAKSSYTATVTASDGVNTTAQTISVNVNDVNETPIFSSGSTFSANENQISVGTVTASDPEGDKLSFSVSGSDLSITSVGALTFNTAPDYEASTSYTATVTVSDGTSSARQLVSVSITDIDDVAPELTSLATFSAAENQTTIGTVAATDADSDNASIRFTVSESDLEIDAVSGVLRFQAAPDYETKSSYIATVTATDGANSTTQVVTISITDIIEYTPPVNTSGAFELLGNTVTLEDYNPASQTVITNQFDLDFVGGVASADLRSASLNLTNIKNGTTSPVGDYLDTLLRFDLNDALPLGNGTGTVDLYVTTGSDGIRASNESQLHCQLKINWSSDGISASILEPSQDISLKVNRTGLMISTTINEFDIMTVAADELTGVKTLDIKLLSALSEGVRVAGSLLNSLLVPRTLHIKVATTLLINDVDGEVVSEFDSIIRLAN